MFKKKVELIKAINYPEDIVDNPTFMFGQDNRVYRSLNNLFEAFWIYNKKELYLVGGCVRDMLLNKQPKDYDLCTNATVDEVKEIVEKLGLKTFDSGIKHGTITVIDDFFKMSYEITTYRIDGKYSDGRHPDDVTFTKSLEEDLKRRDFTINSFAYNLLSNELVMLDESFLDDLNMRIIRTVGDPAERYEEDALRMLRAIRFAAQLGFSIETYTYKALSMCAPLLKKISKERIRDELTKILLSDNPQMLEFICVNGLEEQFFLEPYISNMLNCDHQNPWHYTDVFHHTMDVVKRLPKEFNLRWAGLLHDIGKPRVKKLKEGTVDHYRYIGHPEESARIADIVMDTLKFSNDQKDVIHKMVLFHDYPLSQCSNRKFKLKVVEIGEENFDNFIRLREADALAHKLVKSTDFAIDAVSKVKERYLKLIREKCPLRISDLAVNGDDLMNEFGIKGKTVGIVLRHLLDLVLDNPQMNTKERLFKHLHNTKDMMYTYLTN